ncbi:hypothetical protein [Dokdonella ginsengisoli]|uniref:Uncharacterized protein n=1 Tax=Dokdonella ginsengisoli TaxID=363846 RepID=A0ABV9QSX8_9GAMM
MDSKDANDTLAAAAAGAAGWQAQDVEILGKPALDRGGCRFYNAVHRRRMDGPTVELAQLPDGRVVAGIPGRGDVAAAADILRLCGTGAPADWWAEIVVRFSGKATGKVVKSRKEAHDVGEIEKRGAQFHEPELEQAGDSTQLRFFSVRYEPDQPFRVSASLSAQGSLTVASEPLGAQ